MSWKEYEERWRARDPEGFARHTEQVAAALAALDKLPEVPDTIDPAECTRTHRGPEGPNEDMAQCPACWSLTYSLRPEGETFGWHRADCSLPLRHESYCQPGGKGHAVPDGEKIRGYFPVRELQNPETD